MIKLVRTSLGVIACAALASCGTTAQTASLECGAGGAIAAYAICKALHNSDASCTAAAALVGAGGAAACYSYGASLDKRRKELAGHENDLDARIQYTRGLNQDSQKLNSDLGDQVAAVTKQTDMLVAQIRQNRISASQLAQERTKLDSAVKKASDQVAQAGGALNEIKNYRDGLRRPSADLDAAIARQQQLYVDAQQKVALLSEQRSRIA